MNFFSCGTINTPGTNQEILIKKELLGEVKYFQPERGDHYRSKDEPRLFYIPRYDAHISQLGHRVILEVASEDLKIFTKMLGITLDPGQESFKIEATKGPEPDDSLFMPN